MTNRSTHRFAFTALATAFFATGLALAQQILPPVGGGSVLPPPPESRPSAPAPAPVATAPTTQTAESILQGLLRDKGTTTGPGADAFAPATGPALGADGLLREGQTMDLRSGHLVKTEDGVVQFVFDAREEPKYPAMNVLPSRRLAAMEDAAGLSDGRKGADMTFRIFAEVTQYRGKNYLYIKPSGIPIPAPASAPASGPATAPATAAAMAMVAAPVTPTVTRLPEGTLILNRTGRLVRDLKTGAELFVLDSDGKQMLDPPMGVISCKLLAVMEDATENGNKAVKFRISGEVTQYRGKNYLYLKAMSEIKDLHQGITPGLGGA